MLGVTFLPHFTWAKVSSILLGTRTMREIQGYTVMNQPRKIGATRMLLIQVNYTFKGVEKTLVLDLNNEDHQDRITSTLLWAAHNEVTLHIGSIPSRPVSKGVVVTHI